MAQIRIDENLSEYLQYDHSLVPIRTIKGFLSSIDDMSIECHWHNDLEFTVVLNGKMNYFVNGKQYHLKKGDGIFVNSNRMHYGFSSNNQDCEFFCIVIHPSLLKGNKFIEEKYVNPLLENQTMDAIQLDNLEFFKHKIIVQLHEMYQLCQSENDGYELSAQSKIFEIWELMYNNLHGVNEIEIPIQDVDTLKSMVSFIQQNYTDKVLIRDIASSGSICRTKCCKIFKTYLDTSPNAFLINYRLLKCKELIRQNELTLTEISLSCGFQSSSYFTETFHKNIGITPKAYKENHTRQLVNNQ